MKNIYCQEVIIDTTRTKGSGKSPISPTRKITEVYTKEGTLIATSDPIGDFSKEDMIAFARHIREQSKTLPLNEVFDSWTKAF